MPEAPALHGNGPDGDRADRELAAQYEAYPYPERDPRDEARRLVIGSPSHLREIDHWVFGARRPRSTPLRALVAGCGTGDGAIMLAQQLARAGRPGHVLCLDRSARALDTVRARAQARKLANIDFREASLLDLPQLELGPFDYIDCCGVLHHLPDPDRTLSDLCRLLAPGGGIGLMVYAPHGRTGVYMLQDALARLAPSDEAPQARLDIARRVMRHLPRTAWLQANSNFGDHLSGGDAGLYDLLLNPRDRAYDLPAFHALLDGAGLDVAALVEPARYDPALLLPDARLRARLERLPARERAAVAEALAGNMNTHVAYTVRAESGCRRPTRWTPARCRSRARSRPPSWPGRSDPTAACRTGSASCRCACRCRRWRVPCSTWSTANAMSPRSARRCGRAASAGRVSRPPGARPPRRSAA